MERVIITVIFRTIPSYFGLINLYKATKESKYLDLSEKLIADMLNLFGDDIHKGLFFYGNKSERLVLRPKGFYDGAIPSGNGFALIDLINIYVVTKEDKYAKIAKEILYSFGGDINKNPLAHLFSLLSMKNFI